MSERLNLLFRTREDGSFELQVKESWSERTICSSFVPPYTSRQLNTLLKNINNLESDDRELHKIGQNLFQALCGSETPGMSRLTSSEQSVQAVLRRVIQRTLRRRGTIALTLSFAQGCEEFMRYPWELLHNGDHFLLASGIFTLTRAFVSPDGLAGTQLPVQPPLRILYIGASPIDCLTLETELSYEALERALGSLIDEKKIYLDRLEPPTFDQLVRYLNVRGGVGDLNDSENDIPCYVIHFDGHGAHGYFCPKCGAFNSAETHICDECQASLKRVKAQTYLCFCDTQNQKSYIDTQSLRELLISSDVQLAVFAACETATLGEEKDVHRHKRAAIDTTLATALVMDQVPAVVAMPFSLQDDLSPTFTFHFYEALAAGRTLEEALSRARQALLPMSRQWFIPVLYRHVVEGQERPVPLLTGHDVSDDHDIPLAHLGAPTTFVGRKKELADLDELLTEVVSDEEQRFDVRNQHRLRPGTHHLVLTGPAGIGKSALAYETVRRNREKFPGGIIGVSLQGGKSFSNALFEFAHQLPVPAQNFQSSNLANREQLVLNAFRALANRRLPCLLLLDRFDEVQEQAEVKMWLHFLCGLPEQAVVLLTSHMNPALVAALEDATCRWYEYRVDKMTSEDLFQLFTELATANSLYERIHLDDPQQQEILQEICTLLDGYPLGAELIFGMARIGERVFVPEAATRSLEEVRDELKDSHLEGIWAVLDVAYRRLGPPAQLLLPYLSVFKLPFSKEQILMLVKPEAPASARAAGRLELEHTLEESRSAAQEGQHPAEMGVPPELMNNWSTARDELVQASFLQFDGRVYTIHPQVRHFAFSRLPLKERQRVLRVVATYYSSLPQPSPDEWFVAFDHLVEAGEPQDLHKAVHLAVHASWALAGHGHALELRAILRRAEVYALQLGDKTGEGQIQCCLGGILRQQGKYAEAIGCLTRSLTLHTEQQESDEAAWALYELAMLFREEGDYRQADQHAQQALDLFHKVGDTKGEAWMHIVLGEVSRGYARFQKALQQFNQALEKFRRLAGGHTLEEGYALALRDRGTVYEALGDYSQALKDSEEALRIFSTLGLQRWQAWTLIDQSAVFLDRERYDEAEKACRDGIVIFRKQGDRRGEGWALRALGDIARTKRDFNDASSYYDEALAIFNALGDRVDQARVINALAAILLEEGDSLRAQEQFEYAQTIAREYEARQLEGRALRGLGDVAGRMQKVAEAEQYYQKALDIAIALETHAERSAILHHLGDLYAMQSRNLQALEAWVQSLTYDRRLDHPKRQRLQKQVNDFVEKYHLEEAYQKFCQQYGLQIT